MIITDLIPDSTDEYRDFRIQFGTIFISEPDGEFLCYDSKKEKDCYIFPPEITKEQVESLWRNSLSTKKDLVTEYLKKYGSKYTYPKGAIL